MKPSLIPLPQKTEYTGGVSRINSGTAVDVREDSSLPAEGYTLVIDGGRIFLAYGGKAGEFYGRMTLRQIIETTAGECDNLRIEDYPRFGYRGFLIDCARHFFTVDELKKIIDSAAFLKLNVFHWHLTDDQGWRLPVEKHPLLTEEGGKRKNSLFSGYDEGREYAYSYTKPDIKEIVDYCREKFIEVVPEIDMPGHTTSVLHVYPELGCTGERPDVAMKEGIYDTVLCLGNPDTMIFVKEVLDEVCDMFPGKYIHIGGDEAPRKKWQECPKCRKKLTELGTDDFDRLQGSFIKDVASYLRSKGKEAVTWNESLKGGVLTKDDVAVQRWMDRKNLSKKFASEGGNIIDSDFFRCYYDYPYGQTPVKKAYSFSPLPYAMGTEGELWTEYVRSFDGLCQKLYPRISALAENAWGNQENKNYKDFVKRHEALGKSFENMGIKIIPVKEWNLPFYMRLPDMWKFYKGSVSKDNIKSNIDNM